MRQDTHKTLHVFNKKHSDHNLHKYIHYFANVLTSIIIEKTPTHILHILNNIQFF